MIILLIIGILLTGLAIGSLARVTDLAPRRAYALRRRAQTRRGVRLHESSEHGEEGSGGLRDKLDDVATSSAPPSAVDPRAGGTERIKRDLIAAGMYSVTPGRFLGYRVLCAIACPLLWIWLGATVGVKPVQLILVAGIIGFLGWWLPARIIQRRAKQRLDEIDYQLPELIDLLVVTIEAGLGFVGRCRWPRVALARRSARRSS